MDGGSPFAPLFAQLDAERAAIRAAEAAAAAALERMRRHVLERLAQLGDEWRQPLVHELYWYHPDVRVRWLGEALGMNDGQVRDLAGPAVVDLVCARCGQYVEVRSRSEAKAAIERLAGPPEYAGQPLCPRCITRLSAMRREESAREWHGRERRLQELRTMPYAAYLQTPEWRAIRERKNRRAGYRCQLCNADTRQLHVHHRSYERRGGERDTDLISLCDQCHAKFHDRLPPA